MIERFHDIFVQYIKYIKICGKINNKHTENIQKTYRKHTENMQKNILKTYYSEE